MNEENEEFEREMNYKSPSQAIGDSVAREFADGQEEDKDGWVTVSSPKIAEFITVLDFEDGRVYQYGIEKNGWNPDHESMEEFLTEVGHKLSNCEWMCHENPEVITP